MEKSGLENLSFRSSSTYRVMDEIGRGGMGVIFLSHKNTGNVVDHVVLKCLKSIESEDEEKLRQEASIATMLRHENIVKTYGLETIPFSKMPEDFKQIISKDSSESTESFLSMFAVKKKTKEEKYLLCLVMDYIKGTDFYTLLMNHLQQDLLFPIPLAAFVISRIASALSYAHTYIIHRDISPENILISEQGVCKLTDFGIAVVSQQQPEDWAGKLMYMAPEQMRNEKIDERADIFALGLVAYQAVTGIPLLYASSSLSFEEQLRMVYSQTENDLVPPHLVKKDVPLELSKIISRMLSATPEYRYQRAAAVVNDLEKEYLYAKGYGPTNNSLAAYIHIFKSNFQDYDEEQLQQLSFLKDQNGQIVLKRHLSVDGYTKQGQHLLAERKGALIVKRLRELYKKQKPVTQAMPRPNQAPMLKVKYLDNVIESFTLQENAILTIGRGAHNNIVIPQKIISNHHANVYLQNNTPILEDAKSQNGLLVNTVKIERAALKEGDKIQIGTTMMYFLWDRKLAPSQHTFFLEKGLTEEQIACEDFTLQFFPTEANFVTLHKIVEKILTQTKLEGIKRNIIPPALYEASQIFYSGNPNSTMEIKIIRSHRYLGFYFVALENNKGYGEFLGSILSRMEKDLDPRMQFEPAAIALSMILKAFDRVELFRSAQEVGLFHFFV